MKLAEELRQYAQVGSSLDLPSPKRTALAAADLIESLEEQLETLRETLEIISENEGATFSGGVARVALSATEITGDGSGEALPPIASGCSAPRTFNPRPHPMRSKPQERKVRMDTKESLTAALNALVKMIQDANLKPELRIEAAKIILNRPRFFVDTEHEEK